MTGWLGGVGYRLLPIITGVAFFTFVPRPVPAAEISLSDLRGYSIDAEWISTERKTLVETSGRGKRSNVSHRYVDKIYISKTQRIFHRRQFYDDSSRKPFWSFDNIRSGRGERFEWGPDSTFIYRGIPSDDKERTNYTRIVRIALSQSGGSYSCSVKASLALQKGEKQYKKYEPSGRHRIIHSFKARQKSCRVFKGNVFKGEVGP